MKRLATILLGVLLLSGQQAPTFAFAGPAADNAAAGSGCACGKSCCVSRSDDPAPRGPVQIPPSSARADFQGAVSLPSAWFLLPPLVGDASPVAATGRVPTAFPVPIYDRDCSYLI